MKTLSKKSCKNCYYGDKCTENSICRYYTPIDDDIENDLINEFNKKNFEEYKKAWTIYTKEQKNIYYPFKLIK